MAKFHYRALNDKGKTIQGDLEVNNLKQLNATLKKMGLVLLDAKEKEKPTNKLQKTLLEGFFKSKIKSVDLTLFTRQIATLLDAGGNLNSSLQLLEKSSEGDALKRVYRSLQSSLAGGLSFSAALSQSPLVFPDDYIATIGAAEESGHIIEALVRLADEVELSSRSRQQIFSALSYPIIMTGISLLIVAMMMIYVVPQVSEAFLSTDNALPLSTQIVVAISDFLNSYGIYVFLGLLIMIALFVYYYHRFFSFRLFVQKKLLLSYGLGGLIVASDLSRWSRSLSLLLRSGVPTLQAFHIGAQVINNLCLRQAMQEANEQIREGVSIASALSKAPHVPSFVVHLCQSGETSGNLSELMGRISSYYENLVKTRLEIFLKLFEPFLILIMGGVVLMIVLAILLPILQINQLV